MYFRIGIERDVLINYRNDPDNCLPGLESENYLLCDLTQSELSVTTCSKYEPLIHSRRVLSDRGGGGFSLRIVNFSWL